VERGSASGFEIYLAKGAWEEASVSFSNSPKLTHVLDSSGKVTAGDDVRLDVTPAVTGPGAYTFAIVTSAMHSVAVASRETRHDPTLAVTTGRWCSGVRIQPGDDIQAAIEQHGDGTTFCLEAGIHRLGDRLYPRTRQKFIGEEGAILSGSKRLNDFSRDGDSWVAEGQTQEIGPGAGVCSPSGYSGCQLPERVFVDDVSLWQVTSRSALSGGEFYFDHGADRIYLADDPAGHIVELTVATQAFAAWSGNDVEVRNLVIEKFGSPAQGAALGGQGSIGWKMINNEVRLSSGIGICGGQDAVVRSNDVHDQGQMGLCGQMSGGSYINNTVAHNNVDGFSVYWEAGGSKWVKTTGLTVSGNFFHDNIGFGLWTDGSNYRTTYTNNRVEDNDGLGIVHEVSYDAVIRDNFVLGNGAETEAELDGAGIMIGSSPNVEVVRNTVIGNADGIALKQHSTGSGDRGPFVVRDAWIHDNVILMCEGESGGVQTVGDDALFTSRDNRFDHNVYYLDPGRSVAWRWLGDFRNRKRWLAYGQDVHSRFRDATC
jgi:parallel beta-helix repeat protein